MRNLIIVLCLSLFVGCKENSKQKESSEHENIIEKAKKELKPHQACFFQVSGEGRLKDSVLLKLNIHGDAVTGVYDWIPAEKDARHGKVLANKAGKTIKGNYTFMQEGKKMTQPIVIKLLDSAAEVTVNPHMEGEMQMHIKKMPCP